MAFKQHIKLLIAITGPDASGKTTLARLLAKLLARSGCKVKVYRVRGSHTFAYLLVQLMKRVLKIRGNNLHYYEVWIPPRARRLWITIEILSVIPHLVYIMLLRTRYMVILERSFIDLLVWIYSGLRVKRVKLTILSRFLLMLAMRYNTIYVTARPRILLARKPQEGFLILSVYKYYEAMARALNLRYIDTSDHTVAESFKELWSIVSQFMRISR